MSLASPLFWAEREMWKGNPPVVALQRESLLLKAPRVRYYNLSDELDWEKYQIPHVGYDFSLRYCYHTGDWFHSIAAVAQV